MAVALLLLLGLFLPLAKSQRFPYVSFYGQTLDNHSYVDLGQVGDDYYSGDSVQCTSDLSTCCSGSQGWHRGDWYFPNGTRLPFSGRGDIYENRGSLRVDLRRRNNTNSSVGIYRCYIAVHDDGDNSVRHTVYVGLYTGIGMSLLIDVVLSLLMWALQED